MQDRAKHEQGGTRVVEPSFHDTAAGRRIAYHKTEGKGPGVVFLGGFKSDMEGTKALALEAWAKQAGRSFLRFDYSGHGQSSGAFTDGCIGEWAEDARSVIEAVTKGPQVLVGSSMGGWISALLIRELGKKCAGFVGVAAAPDFTEDSMWRDLNEIERAKLKREGQIFLPSDYGDPYPITRKLIEDGRRNLVLREPLQMPFPVRLLQGTADADVERQVALNLLDNIRGDDVRLTFVKGADHRFSDEACLALLIQSVEEVLA
jgi:pimeloyl-ACP methyl ester carboxylesterase